MKSQLNLAPSEIAEVKRTLTSNSVGAAEFELAYQKAIEYTTTAYALSKAIDKEIGKFRDTLLGSGTIGTIAMSADAWNQHYQAADRKAREVLMSSSAEIRTLDELEAQALEAQRKANQKRAELEALYSEFVSLPARAANLTEKLENIQAIRTTLNLEALKAQFSELYRLPAIDGARQYTADVESVAAIISTVDLRLAVLADSETKLATEFEKLEARNKVLAKLLGRPKNQLK
jgi:hypothetical protein